MLLSQNAFSLLFLLLSLPSPYKVRVDCIRTDLVTAVEQRLAQAVDVLLFNPPYVPTESDEIRGTGIEISWAGGVDGREVTDRLLPKLKVSDCCLLLFLSVSSPPLLFC
jgi:hypothetical protein